MITARIDKDTDGKGLWLFIDNGDESSAWPLLPEEVEPIFNACNEWLLNKIKEKSC